MAGQSRAELIQAVISEIDRVWGEAGLTGTHLDYEWLLANTGITEQDDVMWQFIVQEASGDVDELENELDDDEQAFLASDEAVIPFLESFIRRYQTTAPHPNAAHTD